MNDEELYGKLEEIIIKEAKKVFREYYSEQYHNTETETQFITIYSMGYTKGVDFMKQAVGNFILLNEVATR
jgi:hypothetical protein